MNRRSRHEDRVDPRLASYRLRIAPSQIHGLGVFAAEDISPGRKVIEYSGERLDVSGLRALIKRIGNARAMRLRYLLRYHRNEFVDGAVGGSGAERINHSCDPNLSVRKISGHILFFSRRRIQRGEELTLDYRYPHPPKAPRASCHCGSPKCRGTINREK